jgi:hypothetical protein
MVGHFRAVPGEHTAQHVRPTFWHHTFGTTADDIAPESGGIRCAPAVRSTSEVARTTWPARNRSAPARTPWTQCPRRPAGARPACRCGPCRPSARLWRPGGRPTRRSWRREGPMRSLGRRCRVQSAARTERTRVALGRLRHEVMGATCCANVLPVLSRAHQRYGQHQRLLACARLPGSPVGGPAVA